VSNVVALRSPDHRAREASRWVARLDRGLTAAETRKLKHWLKLEDNNAAALKDTTALWDRLDTLAQLADVFPRPARSQPSPVTHWLKAAASISLVVIACFTGVWLAISRSDLHTPSPINTAAPAATTTTSLAVDP